MPWVQPWGTAAAKAPLAMPKNAATQRRYSGMNVLILWGAVIERGFAGQSWLTFRQALSLGGNVRKGERGERLVNFDANVVAPNGAAPVSYSRAKNTCNLICHGQAHGTGLPVAPGSARTGRVGHK